MDSLLVVSYQGQSITVQPSIPSRSRPLTSCSGMVVCIHQHNLSFSSAELTIGVTLEDLSRKE
jgi:hypothetical protein